MNATDDDLILLLRFAFDRYAAGATLEEIITLRDELNKAIKEMAGL